MKLKITVHGVAYEVDVEVLDAGEGFPAAAALPLPTGPAKGAASAPPAARPSAGPVGASASGVNSPIAGVVLEILCKPGDTVDAGQPLLVLEAMKMKTDISAPSAGKVVKRIAVAVGDNVREGQALVEFE